MNEQKYARAEQAFPQWASLPIQKRRRYIARLRKAIVERQMEIASAVSSETGKPLADVICQEITAALEMMRVLERKYPVWLKPKKFRYWRPGFLMKSNAVHFEPLGPVAVIGPSNFSFSLPILAASSCLLCGNTVLIKPSEHCPQTAGIIRSLICESGLPEGVAQVIEGQEDVVREAIAQPVVRKVFFIGSSSAGKEVAELCGRFFKPCVLELGGRDGAIICDDADLKWAARGIAWSSFYAAGGSCVGTKLAFVPSGCSQEINRLLLEELKSIRRGDVLDPSTEVGRIKDFNKLRLMRDLVLDALAKGASAWSQKGEILSEALSAEHLEGPVVLLDVTPSMRIMSNEEEISVPVLAVRRVFSVEQAVKEANSSPYGLGASIWTHNLKKAQEIAAQLRVGMVWINDSSVGLPFFPWGGTKRSGWGRLFSKLALTELTCLKVISTERRCLGLARRKFWWFPYSKQKSDIFLRLNEFLYSKKRWKKLPALASALSRYLFRSKKRFKEKQDSRPEIKNCSSSISDFKKKN